MLMVRISFLVRCGLIDIARSNLHLNTAGSESQLRRALDLMRTVSGDLQDFGFSYAA